MTMAELVDVLVAAARDEGRARLELSGVAARRDGIPRHGYSSRELLKANDLVLELEAKLEHAETNTTRARAAVLEQHAEDVHTARNEGHPPCCR